MLGHRCQPAHLTYTASVIWCGKCPRTWQLTPKRWELLVGVFARAARERAQRERTAKV